MRPRARELPPFAIAWSPQWSGSAPASSSLVAHHADVLGHLIGLLSGARPRMRDGCFLYVSDRGLARRLLTRRGYVAITFGHVIVFAQEPTPLLWRHELVHVRQYARYGLAFLPLYLWLYARRGYAAHPFEREATELARLEA